MLWRLDNDGGRENLQVLDKIVRNWNLKNEITVNIILYEVFLKTKAATPIEDREGKKEGQVAETKRAG